MKIELHQAYSFHQIGKRDYQEDSRCPDVDVPDCDQRFFVICDGVGGCEKGEVASQTVCDAFNKSLKDIDFSVDFTNADFKQILDNAYNALDAISNDDNRDMATTLAFICFHGGGTTMAHIGDSRIYQIRPSEGIIYRSDDHSMVNAMVHNGVLTPEQAINHPQSNVITRYMEAVDSDQNRCTATVMQTVDVRPGDYFFLCSDGVLHSISDDELVNILMATDDDLHKINTISALSHDSEDNNTAFLIHVKDVEKDLAMINDEDICDDNHATKKIKVASQNLEEVESVKQAENNSIWNKIINFFNKD